MLNDLDRRILRTLQYTPDAAMHEIADRCGLTAAKVTRRLDKLRDAGLYRGQEAVVDWAALGFEVSVSLRITLDKTQARAFDEFHAAARDVPEVTEIQTFLGRVDVRLFVVARDMAHYQMLYRDRILTLPHISDIEALMLVSTLKSDERLPL